MERIIDEMIKHVIYERIESGKIRILRMYGDTPVVQVPAEWDDMMVTEIGDYCFSENSKKNYGQVSDKNARELSGNYIEQVILPASVRKVGAYAFYKCSALQKIEIGPELVEFGSDAFMNCFSLHEVEVKCGMKDKTGLKQLLAQRNADVLVRFVEGKEICGEIFFPEYYELHDEIGPAHIFAMNISGEGFRARQCFAEGIFLPGAYDAIFEKACAEETDKTLCQMALCRLKTPVQLEENARNQYYNYLHENPTALTQLLCQKRDLSEMVVALEQKLLSDEGRGELVCLATEQDWVEGMAYLLRSQVRDVTVEERYSLDDL